MSYLKGYLVAKYEEHSKCLIYGCQYVKEDKPRKCVRCGAEDEQTFQWYGDSILSYVEDDLDD